jgi:phosphomannomutase
LRQAYVQSAIDVAGITSEATLRRTTRILFNCGNGAAGPTLKAILSNLGVHGVQIDAHVVHGLPDPTFPNGIPNPLLPKNHAATASEVVRLGADFGVAFDGDFDRCFFFDGAGTFVGGEYLVALLAEANLRREAGCTIVHDPRLVYAARDKIRAAGGVAIQSGTGHALVKAKMREVGAAYGGEMSAHHYFRDFFYCDSGMIPWMAIIALLAAEEKTLSECVAALRAAYPSSGEINFQIENKWDALARLRAAYVPHAAEVDEGDGLSCDMGAWRFNVRASNTEDLLRLNVEARGQAVSLDGCVAQLSKIIEGAKA